MAVAGEYFARGETPLVLHKRFLFWRVPTQAVGRDRRFPAKRSAAAVAGSPQPPASRKQAQAHGGSRVGIGTPPHLMNMQEPGRLTPRRLGPSGRARHRLSTRSIR